MNSHFEAVLLGRKESGVGSLRAQRAPAARSFPFFEGSGRRLFEMTESIRDGNDGYVIPVQTGIQKICR